MTQNYYLSKLLFSPDATQSSRILLSKEVHNDSDYQKCIRQFKGRTWPHALLRFNVFDEVSRNPHLISKSFHTFVVYVLIYLQSEDVQMPLVETFSNMVGCGQSISASQRPAVPPPMRRSVSFQMPMTQTTESSNRSNTYAHPQHTVPQHPSSAQATGACCSVSQGKAEVKAMLHNFQEDLNRVMTNNFDEPLRYPSLRPISVDVGPTFVPPPFLCSSCTQHRQGTWYSCDKCHVVVVRI